jgi:pimeloyl-ACP methyl ester carboxylesterase
MTSTSITSSPDAASRWCSSTAAGPTTATDSPSCRAWPGPFVVAYDRREHGDSQRGGQGTRRDQEEDLRALIEALDLAPAHIGGTSFGASIALGLATRRPHLVRSVIAHEPPLMSVVADDARIQPLLAEVQATIEAVLARLARGGDQSPAWFRVIVARLADLKGVELHTYPGAGHAPHLTRPDDYLAAATAFLVRPRERALVP